MIYLKNHYLVIQKQNTIMKQALFALTILLSGFCFSQKSKITSHGTDTIEVISYHKNGRIKDSVWKYIEILVGKPDETDPNHPGDSIVIKNEIPFGVGKSYFKNGQLKNITFYGSNISANRIYDYRKKGSLAVYKETPYGYKKSYNKKGKQIRQADFNKGKFVKIPKKYKKQQHLASTRFNNLSGQSQLQLSTNTKQFIIKPGTLLALKQNNDSTLFRHVVYEGNLHDSLVMSFYNYDQSESKQRLALDKITTIAPAQINEIHYAGKNQRKKHNTAAFMEIAGFNMTLLPLIGGPVIFGAAILLNPAVAAVTVTGLPLYFISKSVYKKTVPVILKSSDYKITFH